MVFLSDQLSDKNRDSSEVKLLGSEKVIIFSDSNFLTLGIEG